MNKTAYKLPPLPEMDVGVQGQVKFAYSDAVIKAYLNTTLAPLLEEIAAREADSAIKAENSETLREQNGKLREALTGMVHYAQCTMDSFSSGRAYLDMTLFPRLIDAARAALGESK